MNNKYMIKQTLRYQDGLDLRGRLNKHLQNKKKAIDTYQRFYEEPGYVMNTLPDPTKTLNELYSDLNYTNRDIKRKFQALRAYFRELRRLQYGRSRSNKYTIQGLIRSTQEEIEKNYALKERIERMIMDRQMGISTEGQRNALYSL
jgi:hypothetical protein